MRERDLLIATSIVKSTCPGLFDDIYRGSENVLEALMIVICHKEVGLSRES